MNKSLVQNTPEWRAMRKNHIGASDAPVIMGVSPYKTPYQLWQEKTGVGPDDVDNQAKKYGRDMEESIREEYIRRKGVVVVPVVLMHSTYGYLMASLDGLSDDKTVAVEIKCANQTDHGEAVNGRVPGKYYPQLQHQMAVSGLNTIDYFSHHRGEYALVAIDRDNAYIDKMYAAEEAFWMCVVTGQEPDLCDRDYVDMSGDDRWDHAINEWKTVNQQLKLFTAKEKELRAALINIAGAKNAMGSGVRLTKVTRVGVVDYNKIPELMGVDLDQYRKASTTSWRIS